MPCHSDPDEEQEERGQEVKLKDKESPLTLAIESPTGFWLLSMYMLFSGYIILFSILRYIFLVPEGRETFDNDWGLFAAAFASFLNGFYIWLLQHVFLFLVVYPVTVYAWRTGCLFPCFGLFVKVIMLSMTAVLARLDQNMGPATRLAVIFETLRLAFKAFSFISQIPKLMLKKEEQTQRPLNHRTSDVLKGPGDDVVSLSHFLYFLFCPTVLYRPLYPRRTSRNIQRMVYNMYIILSMMFFAVKLTSLIVYPVSVVGKESIPVDTFVTSFFWSSSCMGYLCFLALAIGWLQCWQNFMAEVLLFGDRQFYQEYYRTNKFDKFFLTWNRVIQNYLFECIYLPVKSNYGKKWAALMVVLYSSILHDYYLSVSVGGLFFIYVVRMPILIFLKSNDADKKLPNLVWFINFHSMHFAEGAFHFLYVLEYYSRYNCPASSTNAFIDLIVPRFIGCVSLTSYNQTTNIN